MTVGYQKRTHSATHSLKINGENMRKIVIRVTCAVIMVMACNFPAFAFLGDTIGVGVRSISLGEAVVSVADDYSATFYNPAGLGQSKDIFNVNIDWIMPIHTFEVESHVTGDDLRGFDLQGHEMWNPTENAEDKSLDKNRPIVGMTANITKIASALNIPVNVTFGFFAMIPDNFNQAMTLADYIPDIPKFVRFGDVEDQLSMAFSLGVEALKDTLYLGIGGQVKVAGDGDIHATGAAVELQGQEDYLTFQMQIDWRVWGELSPIIGILYTPMDKKLKLGAAFREENSFSIGPSFLEQVYLSQPGEQNLEAPWYATLSFLFGYSPPAYTAGISYQFDSLMISFDLEQQQWSKFEYDETIVYRYSPGEAVLDNQDGYIPNGPEFKDVVNTCVGLEYKWTEAFTLLAGYQNMPTPVPDQSNWISNYIDMDKNLFSIGATYSLKHIKPPGPFKSLPFKFGAVFQYVQCEDITVNKDVLVQGYIYQNHINWQNPEADPTTGRVDGQESYDVAGDVYIFGLSVEINF